MTVGSFELQLVSLSSEISILALSPAQLSMTDTNLSQLLASADRSQSRAQRSHETLASEASSGEKFPGRGPESPRCRPIRGLRPDLQLFGGKSGGQDPGLTCAGPHVRRYTLCRGVLNGEGGEGGEINPIKRV